MIDIEMIRDSATRLYGKNDPKFSRLLVVLFISSFLVISFSTSASAHSQLVSSTPAADSVLTESPKAIELKFTTRMESAPDSIRLFFSNNEPIEISETQNLGEQGLKAEVPKLKSGSYVVSWYAVSPDAHRIEGAFVFTIGSIAEKPTEGSKKLIEKVEENQPSVLLEKRLNVVNRFVQLLTLSIIIAAIIFKIYILKETLSGFSSRIFYACLGLFSITSFVSLVLYVSISKKVPFFEVLFGSDLVNSLDSKFAFVQMARILICVVLGLLWKLKAGRLTYILLGISAVLFASTFSILGHSSTGEKVLLAGIFNAIHVFAAATWLGGIIWILILRKRNDLTDILRKFSNLAVFCVVAILLSGTFAWYRQVGSFSAAKETWFGQLISFKVILVLFVVAIAFIVRRKLLSGSKEVGQILKFVAIEFLMLISVMFATSMVVDAVPAKIDYKKPVTQSVFSETKKFDVTVDPANVGLVEIHIFVYNKDGSIYQVQQKGLGKNDQVLKVAMLNPQSGTEATAAQVRFLGLNHFVVNSVNVPFSGKWEIKLQLETENNKIEKATKVVRIK